MQRKTQVVITLLIIIVLAAFGYYYKQYSIRHTIKRKMMLKFGFIDTKGNVVIPPKYDQVRSFEEGLAPVEINNRWGYINKEGKMVIKPAYKEVNGFSEGLACVYTRNNHIPYFINKTGKIIFKINHKVFISTGFSEGVAVVVFSFGHETCDYGYISKNRKLVSRSDYFYAGDFHNGFAIIKDREGWATINKSFQVVSRIHREPESDEGFLDGLRKVIVGNKYGYSDVYGRIVIKPQFNQAEGFFDGLAAVQIENNEGKWGYIDKKGHIIIKPIYDSANNFSDGLALVISNNPFKSGYIDKNGKIAIQFKFEEARSFSCGLAYVENMGSTCSYINKQGKAIITTKQLAYAKPGEFFIDFTNTGFSDGLAPIALQRMETYIEAKDREFYEKKIYPEDEKDIDYDSCPYN